MFWTKVDRTADCWLWVGARFSDGYGRIFLEGKGKRVHRVAWELCGYALDPSMTLDHLCRVKTCVNPDHLEQVTLGENVRRAALHRSSELMGRANRAKTHCKNGHPYDEKNTYHFLIDGRSARGCRPCRLAAVLRHNAKKEQDNGGYQPE